MVEPTLRGRSRWPARCALGLLAAYWLAIFIGTHLPQDRVWEPGQVSDKVLHGLAYAVLAALLVSALALFRVRVGWRHAALAITILAAYGAVDEWTQLAIGRHCELADWLADLVGASLAAPLAVGLWRAVDARRQGP